MKLIGIVVFSVALQTSALHSETLYCTLSDAMSISDQGIMEPHPLKDVLLSYQATVELEAGKVFHPEFGTSNYDFIEILDHGSDISSFKVIAYSKEGSRLEAGISSFRNAAYFEIKTYAEGPTKPFIAVTGGYFAYGVCK